MKLTEILTLNFEKSEWSHEKFVSARTIRSEGEFLGKRGQTEFWFLSGHGSINAIFNGKTILEVLLYNIKYNVYRVFTLNMINTYTGFNVPYYAYKAFVMKNNVLISGQEQTEGSKILWKKLAQDPQLRVYRWDSRKKDLDDVLRFSDDEIYADRKESDWSVAPDTAENAHIRLILVKR